MGLLNTLETILSVMEENINVRAQLEPIVLQAITHIFTNSVMEFYEEALTLACDLTTSAISPNMWNVLKLIYEVFKRDGFDYFTDMMPVLHNYVTTDTDAFLSNPDQLMALYDMAKTVLEADQGEDPECHAAKLLEVIILQCQGKNIDQVIPLFVQVAFARLAGEIKTSELRTMCLQVIIAALLYDPQVFLASLNSCANAGLAVDFDGCFNCYVHGGCNASQEVRYRGGAMGCRAFLEAESTVGAPDILQIWEDPAANTWGGIVRPDGTVIAYCTNPTSFGACAPGSATAPTAGVWKVGDVVFNREFGPGEPAGWRYSGTDWVAFGAEPLAPLYGPTGSGAGLVSAIDVEVLLANYHLHTLAAGFPGQRVTVVCNVATLWLSSINNAGNIQLDGAASPGLVKWVMSEGDTCTLLCLEDGASTYWREVGRSVA